MPYKLDLKDRKLISLLDKNSRHSNTLLAKKVGLSKPSVEYRIKRMEKRGIILAYYTEIDFSKLGYNHYKLYLKLEKTSLNEEKKIIDYWRLDTNTIWLAQVRGNWDIAISILARNNNEFGLIVGKFMRKYSKYILSQNLLITEYSPLYAREYLAETQKSEFTFGTPSRYKLDVKDAKLIQEISNNSRQSIVEITKKTKLSRDVVLYRLRKLIKDKIITQFRCYPNMNKIGIKHYKLILRTRDLNTEAEKKLKQYVSEHKKATQFLKLIGSWDIEIEFETSDEDELYTILSEIRKEFSSIIRDYDLLRIIKTHKYNYYPF
ncbi:MAG: Lrp/AsnC family transcriptional regulator [Candidatus Ranarchaeia archaeon]